MAQTTVLAAGTTAAVSSNITVAANTTVKVGLFSSEANAVPLGARFNVMSDTPGADQFVATLDNVYRHHVLAGPGTYRVSRNAYSGTAFGVYLET